VRGNLSRQRLSDHDSAMRGTMMQRLSKGSVLGTLFLSIGRWPRLFATPGPLLITYHGWLQPRQ
jgi:hypothetical protein